MADTRPKTKRGWRWLIAGACVCVITVLVSRWRADVALMQRAQQIQPGQSKDVVRSVLGEPHLTSFRGPAGSYCYGSGEAMRWAARTLIYKHLGIGPAPGVGQFPVEVKFGDDGLVSSIRLLQ